MYRDEHKITGIEDCKETKRLERINKKSWATVVDQDIYTELTKLSQAYQILILITIVMFILNPTVTKDLPFPFHHLNDLMFIFCCIAIINLIYRTYGIIGALFVAIVMYAYPVSSILFLLLGVLSFIRKMRKHRVKIDFMGSFDVQVVRWNDTKTTKSDDQQSGELVNKK